MKSLSTALARLLGAAVASSPFVILLALPVFDTGLFRQVEPVAVALHVVAASVAMLFLGLSVADPGALRRAWSPSFVFPALIAVAGAILAPLSDDPARSLHGSLEHGVGILWHLELAVLAGAACFVWSSMPAWRAPLAVSAAGSVLACLALQAIGFRYGSDLLAPYDFKEYLGLNALLAAVPLVALRKRWASVLAALLLAACVAYAANRGSALALAAWAAFAWWAGRARPAVARKRLAAAAVLSAMAIAAALVAAAPLLEKAAVSGASRNADVASAEPIDGVEIQLKPYGTIWTRAVSDRMVVGDLLGAPGLLLTGRGFGAFESVAVRHRREAAGRVFEGPWYKGSSKAYWDGAQKAKFHSHNLLLEELLSAGIGGAALWLGFVGAVAWFAPRRRLRAAALLVATLAVAGSLWFLVNAALPLLALAIAACAPPRLRASRGKAPGAAELGVTVAASVVMLTASAAGAFSYSSAAGEKFERRFVPLIPLAGNKPPCVGFTAVSMPERQINTVLSQVFVRRLVEKGKGAPEAILDSGVNAANFSCLLRAYAYGKGDLLALTASLQMRQRLRAASGPQAKALEQILAPDFAYWQSDVAKLLDLAPGRTDFLIPYFDWLAAEKPSEVPAAAASFLPRLSESDPVRPYVLAAKARVEADRDGFRRHVADALSKGLADLVRLPPETVEAFRTEGVR